MVTEANFNFMVSIRGMFCITKKLLDTAGNYFVHITYDLKYIQQKLNSVTISSGLWLNLIGNEWNSK